MNSPLRFVFCLTLLGSISCASNSAPKEDSIAAPTASKAESGLGNALMTPLSDLNLRRKEIPALLLALTSTYEPVEDSSCDGIASLVTELDSVLGTDDDGVVTKDKGDVALGVIAGATGSIIPLRGVVRRATGASKLEARTIAAFQRGLARRAFLKGIGSEKGCEPPAAPATAS